MQKAKFKKFYFPLLPEEDPPTAVFVSAERGKQTLVEIHRREKQHIYHIISNQHNRLEQNQIITFYTGRPLNVKVWKT